MTKRGLFTSAATAAMLIAAPAAGQADRSAQQFPAEHRCASSPADPVCVEIARMKNPDFSRPQDLVIAPHRGVWSLPVGGVYGGGEPENSGGAIEAAQRAGYRVVEMDIMLTADSDIVSTHDYPLYRTTNESDRTKLVSNQNIRSLLQLRLRRRNGALTGTTYVYGAELITRFKALGLVLLLDPKEEIAKFVSGRCVDYCENQYYTKVSWLRLVKRMVAFAQANDASHLLVIKTLLNPAELLGGVTQTSPRTGVTQSEPGMTPAEFNSVQWVPELLTAAGDTPASIADRVDAWAGHQSALAYVETDFKAEGDAQLAPFDRAGEHYASIIDYLRRRYGVRPGIFSEEPVMPRGVLSRWAVSSMKDSNLDRRADHLWLRSIPGAGFMVVTSDHPEAWDQLREAW